MKKNAILLIVLVVLCQINPAAEAEKLRVNVNNANVRSQPGLTGEIVLKAGKGDIFTIVGKEGDWYKILIPAESGSRDGKAYIHSALGDIISAEAITEESKRQKAIDRPAKTRKAAPAAAAGSEKLFSGFYTKFGYRTKPAGGFGDRWLLSLGKDWGINPFLAAGFELQPYFRSFSDAEFSSSTLGANLFGNAKGGVNIGRFMEKLKFLTPYAGFGLGVAFATSSSKFGSEKVSSTDFNFAWHMMFGIEVILKGMNAILEFQILKVSFPDIDPDPTQYFWMIGIRF
jgi:opacity protein-like surface antigen